MKMFVMLGQRTPDNIVWRTSTYYVSCHCDTMIVLFSSIDTGRCQQFVEFHAKSGGGSSLAPSVFKQWIRVDLERVMLCPTHAHDDSNSIWYWTISPCTYTQPHTRDTSTVNLYDAGLLRDTAGHCVHMPSYRFLPCIITLLLCKYIRGQWNNVWRWSHQLVAPKLKQTLAQLHLCLAFSPHYLYTHMLSVYRFLHYIKHYFIPMQTYDTFIFSNNNNI